MPPTSTGRSSTLLEQAKDDRDQTVITRLQDNRMRSAEYPRCRGRRARIGMLTLRSAAQHRRTRRGGKFMAAGGRPVTELNKNVHQGYFAESLVASIAAAAGLDVQFPRLGAHIDLGVFKPGPGGTSGSRQMTLQVKSWASGEVSADGNFHYPLEVPAYNYLSGNQHDVRHYLVLCVVPYDPAEY